MNKLLIVLMLLSFVLAGCSGKDENQVRSFDGVKISYDVQGTGQPVLVFVHGWSCSKEYWKEQIVHFVKKHKVVTIDLAGHGQSGRSRKDYTVSPAFFFSYVLKPCRSHPTHYPLTARSSVFAVEIDLYQRLCIAREYDRLAYLLVESSVSH